MLQKITLRDGTEFELELTQSDGLQLASRGDAIKKFEEIIETISKVANEMAEGLRNNIAMQADGIELELSLKFGGKTGLIVASGSVDAGVKLKLKWGS